MTIMEARKPQSTTANKSLNAGKAAEFVGDVKAEIKRINWTEKEELITYTKIVVAATFILGLGIYIVDLAIQGALDGLGNIVRMIIG